MTDRPRPPADELDWEPVLAWLPTLRAPGLDVSRFLDCLYDHEVIAPFDWPTWSNEGRGRVLVKQPAAIADASLEECRMLLTTHVRADRFAQGRLRGVLSDGTMTRILERIRTVLAREQGASGDAQTYGYGNAG